MSGVLFSSLQFKIAQCHPWMMKKRKKAKHKTYNKYILHSIIFLEKNIHIHKFSILIQYDRQYTELFTEDTRIEIEALNSKCAQ